MLAHGVRRRGGRRGRIYLYGPRRRPPHRPPHPCAGAVDAVAGRGKIGDRGDRAPWPATPSVRPAYHSASTELAPEVRKERVRELLLGYLHGAAVP